MDKDFIKYLKREIKDLNTKLDLVYGEREILEDILGSVKALSEKLTYHREHIDNIVSDVKADVKEMHDWLPQSDILQAVKWALSYISKKT